MATHEEDDPELHLLEEWDQTDDLLSQKNRFIASCNFFQNRIKEDAILMERYEKELNDNEKNWNDIIERHIKLKWMELHHRIIWLRDEYLSFHSQYDDHIKRIQIAFPNERYLNQFPTFDRIQGMIDHLENQMLYHFYHGNIRLMKHDLFPLSEDVAIWSGFHFGLHFGMMVVLFIWVVWDSVIDDSKNHNLWESSVMAVYRAVGVLILLLWFWCLQVYTYTWYNIPFLSIFDWKITKSTQFVYLVRHAVSITIVYLVNLLLYFKSLRGDIPHFIPPYVIPFILYLVLFLKLIFPLKQRRSLLKTVVRVMTSPWSIVRFREAYVGDILTSLVRVFVDLAWSSCYYFSGAFIEDNPSGNDICSQSTTYHWIIVPLLSALPLWWRFCQNIRKYQETHTRFPYIPNAMKYACAQSVVLFAVFHPTLKHPDNHMTTYQWFYLVACVITTIYQYLWDIYMDWGLGGVHGLRTLRLYPTWTYYTAMLFDFFLRFGWTLTLIPAQGYGPFPSNVQIYLDPILASAEVFRRSMWGLIRVEYEHTIHLRSSQKSIEEFTSEEESDDDDDLDERYSFWVLVEIFAVVTLVVIVAAIAILTR